MAGRKSRITEWLTEDGLLLIEGWARDGLSDQDIMQNLGIKKTAFYKWRNEHPEFDKALKDGRRPLRYIVENKVFEKIKGYREEVQETEEHIIENPDGTVKKEIKRKTKEIFIPPDNTMIIYFLKTHYPDIWNEAIIKSEPEKAAVILSNTLKEIEIAEKKGLTSISPQESGLAEQISKLVENLKGEGDGMETS